MFKDPFLEYSCAVYHLAASLTVMRDHESDCASVHLCVVHVLRIIVCR